MLLSSSLLILPLLTASAHLQRQPIVQYADGGQFLDSKKLTMKNIIHLSNASTAYAFLPQLAMSADNNLNVIWLESTGFFGGSHEQNLNQTQSLSIVYSSSGDNGTTFTDTRTLYNYSNAQSFGGGYPSITSDASRSQVYLAWTDNSTNHIFDVYFTRSLSNGTGFELPTKIHASQLVQEANSTDSETTQKNNNAGTYSGVPERIHYLSSPQIAVSGSDRVYLMWTETFALLTKGPSYLTGLQDASSSSSSYAIDSMMTNASSSNITAFTPSSSNLLDDYSYEDFLPQYDVEHKVLFATSNDSGKSFGTIMTIMNTSHSSTSAISSVSTPFLAASGNNVYVFVSTGSEFYSLRESELFLFRSMDNGTSFEQRTIDVPIDDLTTNANRTLYPVHAHPVIVPNTINNTDSLYMIVTMAENKTESIVEENGARLNRFLPSFLDLSFSEYFIRSDDAGSNFTKPVKVVNRTDSAQSSALAVSQNGSRVYVTWSDPGFDIFDLLQTSIGSGKYISPEQLEELNTAGSTLLLTSSDRGDTFDGDIMRLNGSKPVGSGLSFGSDPGLLIPFGNDGVFVVKTRTSYGGPMERILPTSEVLLWVSNNGASSFEGPIRISGNEEDPDFGMSNFGGGNSVLLGPDALYIGWSASDYGQDYSTRSSDIYLRRIGN